MAEADVRVLLVVDARAQFGALQLRDRHGDEQDEWLTELWTLRTESAVWGTFWTLPYRHDTHSAWVGVHESRLFTEPLIGELELKLSELPPEVLSTRWYSLRPEQAEPTSVRAHPAQACFKGRTQCSAHRTI